MRDANSYNFLISFALKSCKIDVMFKHEQTNIFIETAMMLYRVFAI